MRSNYSVSAKGMASVVKIKENHPQSGNRRKHTISPVKLWLQNHVDEKEKRAKKHINGHNIDDTMILLFSPVTDIIDSLDWIMLLYPAQIKFS